MSDVLSEEWLSQAVDLLVRLVEVAGAIIMTAVVAVGLLELATGEGWSSVVVIMVRQTAFSALDHATQRSAPGRDASRSND